MAEGAAKGAADAGVHEVFVLAAPGEPVTGRPFESLDGDTAEVAQPVCEQRDPGDVAVVVYTAGATGRPKGAELTHFQLFMNADTPGRLFGIRDDDVVLVALSLSHVYALSSRLDVCVGFGMTMTLLPLFEPAARSRSSSGTG